MDWHLSSTPVFSGTMLLISYSFLCVFLLCVFTLCVPYFDVRVDFRIENDVRFIFTSNCWYICIRAHVLFKLFVVSCIEQVQCCGILRLVYSISPFPLKYPFVLPPSVFSKVYCTFVSMRNSHLYNNLELINMHGFGVLSEITANTRIIVKRLLQCSSKRLRQKSACEARKVSSHVFVC